MNRSFGVRRLFRKVLEVLDMFLMIKNGSVLGYFVWFGWIFFVFFEFVLGVKGDRDVWGFKFFLIVLGVYNFFVVFFSILLMILIR